MSDSLTRRDFLKIAGITGISAALGNFELQAKEKTVKVLMWDHFIPTFKPEFESQVNQWAESKGVKARVDYVSYGNLPNRLGTEVESKTGHDIVLLFDYGPGLYRDNLLQIDDVANELKEQYGEWNEGGKYLNYNNGEWRSIPWNYQSLLGNYRVDYWDAVGMAGKDLMGLTWNQFLPKAKEIKKTGHPVALAVGSNNLDSYGFVFPLLWSFGAQYVDREGNVAINSEETRKAIKYVKNLFEYMPRQMLGWDNSGNNKYMISGRGSYTQNPPSIWAVEKMQGDPIAKKLNHIPLPKGPEGRFRLADYNSLGIWKFSNNKDLAKDLLVFLMQEKQFRGQVKAAMGYGQAPLSGLTQAVSDYYENHETLKYYPPQPDETIRAPGYPAPVTSATQIAYNLLVLPQMFGRAIRGRNSIDGAVKWAEKKLNDIYY